MQNSIREAYFRLLSELPADTYRYLFYSFDVEERLVGLVGARGVGKTTLLLQYIKHKLTDKKEKVFYFSADHIYFNKVTLLEYIENMINVEGIKVFFIDEIHKYKNWNQELKNIYDSFPKIKIVFSGSSSLDLIKGKYDLSRRARMYYLYGLSFREYLNFETGKNYKTLSWNELINDYQNISIELSKIDKLQGHFKEYLNIGYYPFIFENKDTYVEKIMTVIDKTIFQDIANFFNLKTQNLHYLKKILYFVATSLPGKTNVHNLALSLGLDDKTTLNYLHILKDTGLIRLLFADSEGHVLIRKPEKIYLDNHSLYFCILSELGQDIKKGTMRELSFLNSLENSSQKVFIGRKDIDFETKDYIFEVGGKSKNASKKSFSLKDKKYFLVKDDILIADRNTIPLYLFGFLY